MESIMEDLMHDIRHSVKIRLDYNMIHVTDEEKLLEVLEYFFKKCLQHGLFFHAAKCDLYGTEVRYCGRIITAEGVRYDPRTMYTLQQMGTPQNGGDLVQYVAALNWMRSSLSLFVEKTAPLQDLLEVFYKEAKGRTKKKTTSVSLDGRWTTECEKAFRNLQEVILTLMTTAHPGPSKRVCVFTDTSDAFYSGMITQVPEHHLDLPVHDQQLQPLAFTSGRFRCSQERWTIHEKEAFAVIETVTNHSYLLLAAEHSILSDHFNLKYMYAPLSLDPSLAIHTFSKIQRWALKLASYNYRIGHIAGELNVWADLLTRWGAAVTNTTSTPRKDSTLRYGSLFLAPFVTDDSDNEFPVASEVLQLRKAAARNPDLKEVPPTKRGAHGLLINDQGKVWIPTNAVSMQVRLCVIAHCGRAGHRGHQVTLTGINYHYYWKCTSKDVKIFVGSCFHCIASSPGETTPRPRGEALRAIKPNEVIHFDYLYMGKSVDDAEFVLIVKDDFSNYVWLKKCKHADADSAVPVLIEWFAAFGVAPQWVSDQGSHFKNQVMTEEQKQLGTKHHTLCGRMAQLKLCASIP
jgi:RNase H-like domain found in reverse transcriptase/Integrase zinc binding domain